MNERIGTCFADGCGQPIYRRLLHQIPGSSEHLIRTHGLLCSKHPCKWTGLTRMDDNPVRWQRCSCQNCKGFRRQYGACCDFCGRIPPERIYIGLLYHRKIISKDIKGLLLQALDNSGPFNCGWCKNIMGIFGAKVPANNQPAVSNNKNIAGTLGDPVINQPDPVINQWCTIQ